MTPKEILILLLAIVLGYAVLFFSIWLFRKEKKEEKKSKE